MPRRFRPTPASGSPARLPKGKTLAEWFRDESPQLYANAALRIRHRRGRGAAPLCSRPSLDIGRRSPILTCDGRREIRLCPVPCTVASLVAPATPGIHRPDRREVRRQRSDERKRNGEDRQGDKGLNPESRPLRRRRAEADAGPRAASRPVLAPVRCGSRSFARRVENPEHGNQHSVKPQFLSSAHPPSGGAMSVKRLSSWPCRGSSGNWGYCIEFLGQIEAGLLRHLQVGIQDRASHRSWRGPPPAHLPRAQHESPPPEKPASAILPKSPIVVKREQNRFHDASSRCC